MSFSTSLVAAHSGLTERQVRYWSKPQRGRPALLQPEYRGRPALWSFRDLVALRMLAYMRVDEGTSLRRIRNAVEALRRVTSEAHLSEHELRAAGGTVLWFPDEGTGVDPVTGQQASRVLLNDVLGEFRAKDGGRVLPLFRPYPDLSVDPEVLSGFPVALGTRVPYDMIAGLVRDGVPPAEVRGYYPSVGVDGARDAVKFAHFVEERTGRTAA